MRKWKTIESKLVFSHPRHKVFIDKVKLPSGDSTDYLHFGSIGDSAMIIAVNDQGKILLQKEYSYPPDDFLYQFPGGLIEKNENPKEGAKRELAEEAKITGKLKQIGWMYLQNRRTNSKMYFFIATELRKLDLDSDLEESFEDFWLSENEITKMIKTNDICNYTALAGWSFYKAHKK